MTSDIVHIDGLCSVLRATPDETPTRIVVVAPGFTATKELLESELEALAMCLNRASGFLAVSLSDGVQRGVGDRRPDCISVIRGVPADRLALDSEWPLRGFVVAHNGVVLKGGSDVVIATFAAASDAIAAALGIQGAVNVENRSRLD